MIRPNRWHAVTLALGLCLVLESPLRVPAQESAARHGTPPRTAPYFDGASKTAHLALIGLIIPDGGDGIAVIEDRRSKQPRLYRLGAVVGGARLTKILPDRVKLADGDGEFELRLAGSPGGASTAPPPSSPLVVVSRPTPSPQPPVPEPPVDERSSALPRLERTHLDQLLRTPDLVMNVTPLEGRGVRVGEIRKASLFEILGLRKGDIIRNVNGNVPGAAVPLPQVIEQTADWGMLRFELERNGRTEVEYIHVRPAGASLR